MQKSAAKIPCSITMLTFNSAGDLSACLESLKEFEEIIVCDGNSSDRTREIALSFGTRVITQYDTDEPDTPCSMDKAGRRERARAVATMPWQFFMDSDDGLSPQVIEEIRTIVSNPNPTHFVWRMPSRVFTAGKEIKHYASYPAYQTRLVHKSVGAHFRGEVHERLEFDAEKFPPGTMQNFYDFHWPKERVANYWGYLGGYAKRELEVMRFSTFGDFIFWQVYRRTRTILGYMLWRLPAMYVRNGFKESMPLTIELITVRYHCALLFGSIKKYVATRVWAVMFTETLRGKDLNRILSNIAVREWEAYGRVLDIGGREGSSSYWRFLRHTKWMRQTTLDIDAASKPDVVLNLESEAMPFAPGHFDTALFFNVLEHVKNGDEVLTKIAAVLRPGGTLVGVVPFLVAVHPDPHDYMRYTNEGLHNVLTAAGFSKVEILPVSRGPIAASYYQSEFLWPRVLKLVLLPPVLLLDSFLTFLRPNYKNKFVLSYAFRAVR